MSRAFPEGGLPALFPLAHGSKGKKKHNTPIQKSDAEMGVRRASGAASRGLRIRSTACASDHPFCSSARLVVRGVGSPGWLRAEDAPAPGQRFLCRPARHYSGQDQETKAGGRKGGVERISDMHRAVEKAEALGDGAR